MYFTDDRYAADVHCRGGCLLASQMLPWSSNYIPSLEHDE
jgi:hypothetical protein